MPPKRVKTEDDFIDDDDAEEEPENGDGQEEEEADEDEDVKPKARAIKAKAPPAKAAKKEGAPKKAAAPAAKPPAKKAKKEAPPSEELSLDVEDGENGEKYIELGKMKRVTVREFKGTTLIDIREMYTEKGTGDAKPGKKGISLTVDQWKALTSASSKISDLLD